MRRFIVEAAADVVLLVAVGWFLSLIPVAQPFPFGTGSAPMITFSDQGPGAVVLLAISVALVNRFVRPLIVAFTGRLVLATAGLFLVVITWLVFWVASVLAPREAFVVADPHWLWILLASALFGVLSALVDAVSGLNRPTLDIEGRGRFIWRMLDGLPTPRRNAVIENLRFVYRVGRARPHTDR